MGINHCLTNKITKMGITNQDGGELEMVKPTTVARTTRASEAVMPSAVNGTIGALGPSGANCVTTTPSASFTSCLMV